MRRGRKTGGIRRKSRPSAASTADLYLNRECMDANGYYIEQNNLVAW
jgi:hypothetical protein